MSCRRRHKKIHSNLPVQLHSHPQGTPVYSAYKHLKQNETIIRNFDVLLAVHLSIFILVIIQLDAQNLTVSLFHASTCFEHHVFIVRRSELHYTASGIITPIGACPLSTCARDGHL